MKSFTFERSLEKKKTRWGFITTPKGQLKTTSLGTDSKSASTTRNGTNNDEKMLLTLYNF